MQNHNLSQAWYISTMYGDNSAYAMGYGEAECPENLPGSWEYWAYESDQDWIQDPEAGFVCL